MNQQKLHSRRTQPVSKNIRFLSLLLITIIFLNCFVSCKNNEDENKTTPPTNQELITERIETFLTAYNDGDMEVVLECLDAKTRNTFQAMLNIFGGLVGGATGFNIDLSDLFSLGVSTTSGDFMKLEITDITVIDSSNASATTKMDLTGAETQTIYFVMVFENDGWYIHDMTDNNKNPSTSTPEKEEFDKDEILAGVDASFLQASTSSEGLQYTLSEDKTYYILTGLGECEDTHIVLPEYPVDYNPIPLKEIRASFYDVEYITIPASVTKIHSTGWSYSYSDLIALNYLGELEQWCTMEYSDKLANPCADNAVLYVSGAPIVETLKIPDTTKYISNYAFYNYDKISKIEIGKNVESIGAKSFYGCENLQSISYGNDKVLSIGTEAFAFCTKLKDVSLGNKIQSIGTSSFVDCSSLEEIVLDNTVKEIGDNAFANCINLKTITKGNTATDISGSSFTNTAFYNNVSNWESGALYIGNCLYAIKPDVVNLNMKDGTLTISNDVFKNHKNITNVVLSDSIESVTESMFENCKSLKSIILPSTLKSIENNAFRYCSSLVEIVIPDSVESIGVYAFYNCSSLKSITFGNGIKTIKDCLRYTALETIRYNGTFDQWIQIDNNHNSAYREAEMCGCIVYSTQTGVPIDAFYYNGHYYSAFTRQNGTWENAKADCEALGGHLATITSEEENEALINYVQNNSYVGHRAYIGLSDAYEEGNWKWVTGESVDYVNFDTYNNEPNGGDSQNYAMLSTQYRIGYWADENGKGVDWEGFFYICEWESHNN